MKLVDEVFNSERDDPLFKIPFPSLPHPKSRRVFELGRGSMCFFKCCEDHIPIIIQATEVLQVWLSDEKDGRG